MGEITIKTIGSLGPMWEKSKEETILWPEKPEIPAKEVWKHIRTGSKIVRRFNLAGILTFSNEEAYGYPLRV